MADFSSTITIRNGFVSSKLTRTAFRAAQGNWATPPRVEIPGSESDTFRLNPGANNVSEGEVSYRTDSGTTFRVYFRCAASGNTVTVTPAHFARISHNPTGSPLAATVQILEDN